jgi:hypothetical protein
MFDGISPNDRILGSRFDEVSITVARTAPGGEDAKQRMEICTASFVWKMICTLQMSQNVEMVSNIQLKKFGLNVRRYGPQPSISVRSFSQITMPCSMW